MTTVPAHDEVDRIASAWSTQVPDLDISPMHVFSRVDRLARHLETTRRRAFAAHGLTVWQFDVLAALRRAGAPYELTPGRLIAETMVSSGTMTNRIDRLRALGLVERRGSDDDRRIVLVTLTPAGRARVDLAFADLVAREHEALADIPADQQDDLARLLRSALRPFEETA